MDLTVAIIATVMTAATPLLLAALGELVTERAGVLNLGVEGMILAGAVAGFAAAISTDSHALALVAAMLAGAAMATLFAFVTLSLRANQVATGLALTLFGIGLSSLAGQGFVGPAVLSHDILVYASLALVPLTAWFLDRTRPGMILRAVGENHDAAHALGYDVIGVRYLACAWGGAMAGLAGAYLSIAYTPLWVENMSAGRGWIALALVVFAAWRPGRALIGAYLFGGITILQLHAQGVGLAVPAQVLSMLPYLATVAVLVIISADRGRLVQAAPGSLNRVFHPPA